MRSLRTALAGILALFTATAAVAQTFPTVPAQTVIGRLGTPGTSGPSQAIPIATFMGLRTINTTSPLAGGGPLSSDLTLSIIANGITNSLIRQSAALSLIGRSANSTGNVADISAAAASDCVFREASSVVGCGTVATAGIANNAVTNAKTATMAAFTFKGNNTSGSAAPTDVDIAALTTKGSPGAGDFVILSDQAASGAWKKATVSSVGTSSGVSSIAGNTGAFTLTGGITNSTNAIQLDTSYGAKKLLATLTASGSATLADTTNITSSFNTYELVFTAIIPATNGAAPQLQIQSGGTFKSTGYLNACVDIAAAVAPCTANTVNISTSINSTATDATNNPKNTTPGMSGTVRFYNPAAAQITIFNVQMGYLNAANAAAFSILNNGFWNTSGAITGFQFAFNTGNITSGTIKIYGWN